MSSYRVVVIVTCFNYGRFLADSLGSVFSQTRPPDTVIVVDDGSTDETPTLLADWERIEPSLVAIRKANGGQLSSFNAAIGSVGDEDLVFFLDADDSYASDYIETVLGRADSAFPFYLTRPCFFGEEPGPAIGNSSSKTDKTVWLLAASNFLRQWPVWLGGAATSGFVVRGWLLREILPYEDEEGWRICADNVLYYGASSLGHPMAFLTDINFNYRIHGDNGWYRNTDGELISKKREALDRLFTAVDNRQGVRPGTRLAPCVKRFVLACQEYLSLDASERASIGAPSPVQLARRTLKRWIWVLAGLWDKRTPG